MVFVHRCTLGIVPGPEGKAGGESEGFGRAVSLGEMKSEEQKGDEPFRLVASILIVTFVSGAFWLIAWMILDWLKA